MWLMQSEAQTTTRGSLAVSAGASEVAWLFKGASEVTLNFYSLVT